MLCKFAQALRHYYSLIQCITQFKDYFEQGSKKGAFIWLYSYVKRVYQNTEFIVHLQI